MLVCSRHTAWPVLSAFLALCLSGCDKPHRKTAAMVSEVGVVTRTAKDVALTTELPGRTAPYLVAEIRPQVGGILQKRLFEEGSMVNAGQVLYQIDPAPFQAELAKVEATLESARLLARRYEALVKSSAISQQDRDDARSSWLQAKASVDSARIIWVNRLTERRGKMKATVALANKLTRIVWRLLTALLNKSNF